MAKECPFTDRDCVATVSALIAGVDEGRVKALGLEKLALMREALRGDVWSSASSHVEYEDVWVRPLDGACDAAGIPVVAKVRITDVAKEETVVSGISLYLADKANVFTGAMSVFRLELPDDDPHVVPDEIRLNGKPIGDRPVRAKDTTPPPERQPADQAPPPREEPREPEHHVLSPSREHHMRTYVRDSHVALEREMAWCNVPRRERPEGGYRVNDLVLGKLPELTSHGPAPRHHHHHGDDRRYHGHRDDEADYRYFQDSMAMRRESHKLRPRGFNDYSDAARRDDYVDAERYDDRRYSSRPSSRHRPAAGYDDDRDDPHYAAASAHHRRTTRASSRGPSSRVSRQDSYVSVDRHHNDDGYVGGRRRHDSYTTTYTTRSTRREL